jgi:hypothetical protein
MAKKTTEQNVEPKVVETMEEVENISEEDLQQLDEEIQQQKAEADNDPKKSTIAAQSNLRTLGEIIDDLKKPIHPKFLKKLKVGGTTATYVPWLVIIKYLDHFAPGWSTRSEGFSTPIGATVVTHLTIPTSDFGPVTRAGHGFEAHQTTNFKGEIKNTGFGGAPVIASAQAFKRSAVAFSLGAFLYNNGG